jgi:hypothetical protein
MESNEKFNLILDKLLQRTEEGKVEWKATADKNTLLAILKDSSISIQSGHDEYEAGEYYVFDFRNENGEIDASFSVTELDVDNLKKARKVVHLARESSFTKNKTIDRILEQLAA